MKFVFLIIPGYGHVNPMLGVAKGLVEKGHEVIVYNTQEFADKIKAVGAEFRPSPIKIDDIDFRFTRNTLKMAELSLSISRSIIPPFVDCINKEKPDCLVHDSLSLWGKIVARKTKTPAITLSPTMALNVQIILSASNYLASEYLMVIKHPFKMRNVIKQYRELYKENGINNPPFILDMFTNIEDLNIVFTSSYFQPHRERFDTRFKFVGPIIYDRKEETLPHNQFSIGKPLIYISLGTVYNDSLAFYKSLIAIFSEAPYQAVISIGEHIKISDLGKIPNNIIVKNYLPQLEILKRASLFISHGGMNSVNESLYYGVPLILFPQIQEQRINSKRVEELGAGIYYKNRNISKKKLLDYVDNIFSNERYKNNAIKIGKTLKEAGGYKTAVKYILDYLN